jgi:hypothetical protein
MIVRERTRRGDQVKVTFVLTDDELAAAEREGDDEDADVFVTGDFNLWNPGATLLRRRKQTRRASLTLAAGRRYAFRYYRQGHWFDDQDADGYERNGYGERNCVLDLSTPLDGLPT